MIRNDGPGLVFTSPSEELLKGQTKPVEYDPFANIPADVMIQEGKTTVQLDTTSARDIDFF